MKLGLVSWGRRGASVRLLRTTATLLADRGVPFVTSVGSMADELERILEASPQTTVVPVPRHRISMLLGGKPARIATQLTIDHFTGAGVHRLAILMAHPWDMTLMRSARSAGIEVLQLVHDARRHPGDWWPTKRGIRQRLAAADITLCLSSAVANEVRGYAREVRIAPHPATLFDAGARNLESRARHVKRVVFVGRFRTYKGLDLLMRAWPLVRTPGARLLIAGDGPPPRQPLPAGVEVRNAWLTDSEIESIVALADVVVCPYIEASQSGVVPLAHASGIPVVVTPVGGLTEQIVNGVNGVQATACAPEPVAIAIDQALNREWAITQDHTQNDAFVDALLLPRAQISDQPQSGY